MDNNKVYEWLLHSTFTVSAREKSLYSAKPYLSTLVHPGDAFLIFAVELVLYPSGLKSRERR